MRAVILAGGRGTRLRPITGQCPKPLVAIGRFRLLDLLIHQLVASGIVDITLTTGYLAEAFVCYADEYASHHPEVRLSLVTEEEPTGTIGSLALVRGLDDTFLVINGDLLTSLRFGPVVSYHRERQASLTVVSRREQTEVGLGVLSAGSDGWVTDYQEKPRFSYLVSLGIYVCEPCVLDHIYGHTHLDLPDLVKALLASGEPIASYETEQLWFDIGHPAAYARAVEAFARNESVFLSREYAASGE